MDRGPRLVLSVAALLLLGVLAPGCGPALTIGALFGLGTLDKKSDDVNNPPALSVTTPAGVVNDVVAISYRVSDGEGDRANIMVEFDVGSGFQPATASLAVGADGTTNLETSLTGTDHVFLWSSAVDLGFVNQTSPQVVLRITPVDASTSLQGSTASTDPFSVFNEYITTVAQRQPEVGINPFGVALTSDGSVVLADGPGNRVIKIAQIDGATSLLAGTGEAGFNGDGIPGDTAQLNFPTAVAGLKDGSGDVLIADAFNALLRRVDGTNGFITNFAGGGGDIGEAALATEADVFPRDLTIDADGNPFFTEEYRLRSVNLLGTSDLPFPRGNILLPSFSPYDTDPYLVGPGRVVTVVGDNRTPGAGQVPAIGFLPDTASAVAAWGGIMAGTTRLLYFLELGPFNGFPFDDGVGNVYPRLLVANQSGGTVSFRVPGGGTPTTIMLDPGNVTVLLDGNDMPALSDLSDLTLLGERLPVFSTFRNGRLYAVNLDPSGPVTVLTTSVPAGAILPVAGTGVVGLLGDGVDPIQAQLLGPNSFVGDPTSGALYLGEGANRVRVLTGATPVTFGGQTYPANSTGSIPAIPPGTQPGIVTPLFCRPGPGGDLIVTDIAFEDPRSNRVFRVRARDAQIVELLGNGVFGDQGDGGLATSASVGVPFIASTNASGTLLVTADNEHHRVRAVNLSTVPQTLLGVTIQPQEVETVAGTGTASPDPLSVGDGLTPTAATLKKPTSAFFDAQGLLWVSDSGNDRIRVCNTLSVPVTVAGVAISPGTIRTVAGDGTTGTIASDGDGGPGSSAQLNKGGALPGADGLIYIIDGNERSMLEPRIRVLNVKSAAVTLAGVTIQPTHIETVVGSGALRLPDGSNLGDGGPAGAATFRELSGISVRSDGLLFVTDSEDQRLRVANLRSAPAVLGGYSIAPGTIETVIGSGLPGFAGEKILTSSLFFSSPGPGPVDRPSGVLALDDGRLFFCEQGNGALRMANLASSGRRTFGGVGADPGEVVVVAGSRTGKVRAETPEAVTVDPGSGLILFSDNGIFGNEPRVKAVDPTTRVVTLVAGGGQPNAMGSPIGDGGPATQAALGFVRGVHAVSDGSLYVADAGTNRIRFVNRSAAPRAPVLGMTPVLPGHIDTAVDGTGDDNLGNDNNQDVFSGLLDLDIVTQVSQANGILWLGDEGTQRVLRVNQALGMTEGVLGLAFPRGIAAIDANFAYVAQRSFLNGAVRVLEVEYVGPGFNTTVVAGNLTSAAWNGDFLDATSMNFSEVQGIAWDAGPRILYVADTGHHRVVGVNLSGVTVTIAGQDIGPNQARTLAGAGNGTPGFNGDAIPPEVALLNDPTSVAISPDGGLLIVDQGNGRLRRFQR